MTLQIAYFPDFTGDKIEKLEVEPREFYQMEASRHGPLETCLSADMAGGSRFLTLNGRVRRLGRFDQHFERELFEDMMYAHYLRIRAARAARGQGVAFDTEEPRAPEELFARTDIGEYVAVAYQAAWSGWKMARGVL